MSTVHWNSAINGDWSTAADWTGGVVPGAASDVVIDPTGVYTVTVDFSEAAQSLLLDDAGATVANNNTLTLGGALTVEAGTFQLNSSGTVRGGVLAAPGGSFQWNGGLLWGVTFDGVLDLSTPNSSVKTYEGLTLAGANGAGPGIINDTGAGSALIAGYGHINNVTLNIGNDSSYSTVTCPVDQQFTGQTYFTSAVNIVQVGIYAQIYNALGNAGEEIIINGGAIDASLSGGHFRVLNVNNFANEGIITDSNGDTLTIAADGQVNNDAKGLITVKGATLNLLHNASFANAGTLEFGRGAIATLAGRWSNSGTITLASGAGLTLGGTGSSTGVFNAHAGSMLVVSYGAFTLSGAAILNGAVSGTGWLEVASGKVAINKGATVSVNALALSGGDVYVNEGLDLSGTLYMSPGATLTVALGDTLAAPYVQLSGVVNGGGTLSMSEGQIGNLTCIGGTAAVDVTGSVSQEGSLTVGDYSSGGAQLLIGAGATYTINEAADISHGVSARSKLVVAGTLIKAAAGRSKGGISVIDLAATVSGRVEVAGGALDFTDKLSGTGSLTINSKCKLEIGASVAGGLTVAFNGPQASLALLKPSAFAATIGGFAVGDAIDLQHIAATGASVNASNQLVVVDGAATVASLQLAGDYSGATFSVGSDGRGGSDVTLLSVARAARTFATAMAAIGGGGGSLSTPTMVAAGPTPARLASPAA